MRFVVTSQAQILSKSLHQICKLTGEATVIVSDCVVITSVNQQRSLFLRIILREFEQFENSEIVQMKLNVRQLGMLLKGVARMEMYLLDDRLVVQSHCSGIRKTHAFHYQPSEAMEARFTLGCNRIVFNHGTMTQLLGHFPTKVVDLQISCSKSTFTLSSVSDHLSTQLNVEISEFLEYTIVRESTIVVNLSDFKNCLQFGESTGMHMVCTFSQPGFPLILQCQNDLVEAEFVLATVITSSDILDNVPELEADEYDVDEENLPATPPRGGVDSLFSSFVKTSSNSSSSNPSNVILIEDDDDLKENRRNDSPNEIIFIDDDSDRSLSPPPTPRIPKRSFPKEY